MLLILPNTITLLGHALTIAWLMGAPMWIGVVGLLLDAVDGRLARWLKAETAYGAEYDWLVDCTVCCVLVSRWTPLWMLVIVPLQVYLHQRNVRVSARAPVTVVAMLLSMWGHL